jgi:hypothetical protein
MANLTLVSLQVTQGPILADRPGLNVRHGTLNWKRDFGATSLSASVIAQMVGVPNGARILDIVTQVTGGQPSTSTYAVGDGSASARFTTATSLSTGTIIGRLNAAGGYGFRYSVTESDYVTFETIDLAFAAPSSTLTLVVDMMVYYVMDRQNTGEV